MMSFLIGVVIAYQGADQLRRFGAEIYTVDLLGVGILRELGVLMTAIIIAGRSGSAFTAQIGTMRVNEEIDALRTLGLDPIEVLVIPRLFGLLLTLPMLTLYAESDGASRRLPDGVGRARDHDSAIPQRTAVCGCPEDLLGRRVQGAVLRGDYRDDRLL